MSWSTDLAKEFKARNNKNKIGAIVGTVLDRDNLKVGILNNKVMLDNSNTYVTKQFDDLLKVQYNDNGSISYEVNNGDKVLVLASDDNQLFFILDKLI